ncbi:MAG TPA: DNA-formamidopyrimidine glycosylase family protein [Candidatus Limnocylindrales bacterium]
MPEGDTLARTAAGLRPWLVGRPVLAARTGGPGAVPRVESVVGATVTAVESIGKNLVIRLDNGLELRTHLRMQGSWHRYRPGERWRRPPARARLVLEVEGSVAVCFDAPVVELFEQRAEPVHPSLSRLGPDLLAPDTDIAEALRRLRDPARARVPVGEALLDQRALAGIGNEVKSEALWQAACSPWAPVGQLDDARLRRLVELARDILREGAATGRRPRHVYHRAGRPCERCGSIVRMAHQGTELPRQTYWCPGCQGQQPGD